MTLMKQQLMPRLWPYIQPKRLYFYGSIMATVINKVLDLMPPVLIAWTVDTVNQNPPFFLTQLAGQNLYLIAGILAGLTLVIFAFESLFQWLYQLGFKSLAQQVQHQLRLDVYSHLQHREIAFFENHRLGNTMSILNDDTNQLERFLNTGFSSIIQLLIVTMFSAVVMGIISWHLTLLALIPIPIIVWGSLYFQRLIGPFYDDIRSAVGALNSRLENNISGIMIIKSFIAEKFEHARVRRQSEMFLNANLSAIRYNTRYVPLIRLAISVAFAGVLLVGSFWVISGDPTFTIGDLTLFSVLIQRLLWPLTQMGNTIDELERANASAKRLFGILDTPSSIRSPQTPIPLSQVKGALDLQDVDFAYHPEIPIFNGLNCHINAGETIGIAGPTGSGKSTLIKLLWRFYDVNVGTIRLDGVNINQLHLTELRQQMALVSQDVYLFHGSIQDNIAYGREGVGMDAIHDAAKQAELHDFIMSLPDGYESIVGENGIKLSGGQRQRLSIARAILKDAPIMIFDEATSSVDTETERLIQGHVNRLTVGKTAIIIAHRLSTIRHTNRILVINNGQIQEEGSHEQLIQNRQLYHQLWQIQTGETTQSN
ncbi:MAG: ATPase [Actinobacteria bacterium]|nr:ATPase [Actinomycetota bacterium]